MSPCFWFFMSGLRERKTLITLRIFSCITFVLLFSYLKKIRVRNSIMCFYDYEKASVLIFDKRKIKAYCGREIQINIYGIVDKKLGAEIKLSY